VVNGRGRNLSALPAKVHSKKTHSVGFDNYAELGEELLKPRQRKPPGANLLKPLDLAKLAPSRLVAGPPRSAGPTSARIWETRPLADACADVLLIEEVSLTDIRPHEQWRYSSGDIALTPGGYFVEVLCVIHGTIFVRRPDGTIQRFGPAELSVCDLYPDQEEAEELDSTELSEMEDGGADVRLWDDMNAETSRSTTPATNSTNTTGTDSSEAS
jgi:hypothetical protein